MTPEIIVSHVVNKERNNQCDTDKLGFVSNSNHQDHWNTKNNVNHLKIHIIWSMLYELSGIKIAYGILTLRELKSK